MNLPTLLIFIRFCFSPLILFLAYFYGEKSIPYVLMLMYLGLLTDIFDGIIARNKGLSNEKLRRLDSQTDLIFWISIAISTWILRKDVLIDHLYGVYIILTSYLLSIVKFGKETCTHAILSKIWGISLIVAFTSLLGFNKAGMAYHLAIIIGFISHLDVILIILLLPQWAHDIPSSYHALKIRQGKKYNKTQII